MSHRVNFKVYRYGKTIKWNFAAPLLNVQRIMRINYVMSHWIKRILTSFSIKIFKYFYSISYQFPFIKIIGYRKLYAKSDLMKYQNKFSLKSSYLQQPENVLIFSEKKKIMPKIKFLRQRNSNRKLKRIYELSKNRTSSYINQNFPLISPGKAYVNFFNYYLLETQFSRNNVSGSSLRTFLNWSFTQNFLLNSFILNSIFGSIFLDKTFNSSFRQYTLIFSFVTSIFKDIMSAESSGWLKFLYSYLEIFFKNFNISSSLSQKSYKTAEFFFDSKLNLSNIDLEQFFFLKKSLFVIKLIKKNYPQSVFLSNNKCNITVDSAFLLNITRHYMYLIKTKNHETTYSLANLLRYRPGFFLMLKFKSCLSIFSLIKKKNLVNFKCYKNLKFFLFYCFDEVNSLWSRNLSPDYFYKYNKTEAPAQLSTQLVVFLSNVPGVKHGLPEFGNVETIKREWRKQFFLTKKFNFDSLYFTILSNYKKSISTDNYGLTNFWSVLNDNFINKYFFSLNFFCKNSNFNELVFKSPVDLFRKKNKKRYSRPVKIFSDLEKPFNLKIPQKYEALLSVTTKASSVFNFTSYEKELKDSFNKRNRLSSSVYLIKKSLQKLIAINAELTAGALEHNLICYTVNKKNLLNVLNSIISKFVLFFKNNTLSEKKFFYIIKVFKLIERSFAFWQSIQADNLNKKEFINKFFFNFALHKSKNINDIFNCLTFKTLFKWNFGNVPVIFFSSNDIYYDNVIQLKPELVYLESVSKESWLAVRVEKLSKNQPFLIFPVCAFLNQYNFFFIEKNLLYIVKQIFKALSWFKPVFLDKFFDDNFDLKKNQIAVQPVNLLTKKNFKSYFYFKNLIVIYCLNKNNKKFSDANLRIREFGAPNLISQSNGSSRLEIPNFIDYKKPRLNSDVSVNEFLIDSTYFLKLHRSIYKIFGISYEILFYPIHVIFQDNSRFQFLMSQADSFLKAYVSRNPYVLYWLTEFIVVFYATIATKSTNALCKLIANRFKKEYYWNQSLGFMFSVIRSLSLYEFKISGLRIGFHGKFGGQDRAYRLYKIWGVNPCLRNGYLTGSYSSARCHSKYGITDVHVWLTYF